MSSRQKTRIHIIDLCRDLLPFPSFMRRQAQFMRMQFMTEARSGEGQFMHRRCNSFHKHLGRAVREPPLPFARCTRNLSDLTEPAVLRDGQARPLRLPYHLACHTPFYGVNIA